MKFSWTVARSHLTRVTRCTEKVEKAVADRVEAMRAARESGESDSDIGKAAGMSRQAVWKALGGKSGQPKP